MHSRLVQFLLCATIIFIITVAGDLIIRPENVEICNQRIAFLRDKFTLQSRQLYSYLFVHRSKGPPTGHEEETFNSALPRKDDEIVTGWSLGTRKKKYKNGTEVT